MSQFTTLFANGPWGPRPGKPSTPKPTARKPEAQPEVRPPLRDVSSPQPDDLDRLVAETQERLKAMFGGGRGGKGGAGGGSSNNNAERNMLKIFAIGGGLLWLLSGFYIVAPDEQGVVTRFGAYVQTTNPGPNFHLPFPVETVMKTKVTTENIVQVGFRTESSGGALGFARGEEVTRDMPTESMMLTGDENMVDLDFTVRWRIADPKNFLFNVADPEITIRDISESAMREVINRHPIDDAFGDGRGQIQAEVRTLMQRIVDAYKVGVEVTSVELQQVNPPQEVISAFRDVQAARADAEKMRNEALGYANDILPRARGEAAQMTQDAEGYKTAKVTEAEGLASRFTNQRAAFVQGPEVMKRRLYIETMEEMMKNAQVILMGGQSAGNILPYLPLNTTKPANKEGR